MRARKPTDGDLEWGMEILTRALHVEDDQALAADLPAEVLAHTPAAVLHLLLITFGLFTEALRYADRQSTLADGKPRGVMTDQEALQSLAAHVAGLLAGPPDA